MEDAAVSFGAFFKGGWVGLVVIGGEVTRCDEEGWYVADCVRGPMVAVVSNVVPVD